MEDIFQTIQNRMKDFDDDIKDDSMRLKKMRIAWENGRDVYQYKRETGTGINTIAVECGIIESTLQRFVRFYRFYPKGYAQEIDGKPLMWGHYMAVLYLRDQQERDWYLRQAAANGWSTHDIRSRVRNNFYESAGADAAGELGSRGSGELAPKAQHLYTYSAKVLKVVDADTLTVEVDVGFSMRYETKLRLRGINAPEKGTKLGEDAINFVNEELFDQTLRHQDTKTPSVKGSTSVVVSQSPGVPEGVKDSQCPSVIVPQCPQIVIRSYKSEKYGRFLADVWYLKGETDPEKILENGHWLNQVLLDKGYAQKME